jgi:RNA polymerase subunit RPABC4/transcription elongation factor Spt4
LSLQDELSEILSATQESDDLEQLAGFQKRCEVILASVSKTLLAEQDAELREHLQAIEEQAKDTLHAVKQRLAEVKIARMDPEYEQRKAQKQREQELKKQRELQQAQQLLSQGGLGGLLGGIFGGAVGVPAAPTGGAGTAAPSSTAAVSPAAVKCAQCGTELKPGAKFCPECGTPVPREKHCANCGAKLVPTAKFCPECGTRQG